MVAFSDGFYLSLIVARQTFCDEKSEEKAGAKIQVAKKYKVAFDNQIYNLTNKKAFYVLTTENTYSTLTRVELSENDFTEIKNGYLPEFPSFACPQHYDLHTDSELLTKFKDEENGFVRVGILSAQKFNEIGSNAKNKALLTNKMPQQQFEMVALFHGEETAKKLLQNILGQKEEKKADSKN